MTYTIDESNLERQRLLAKVLNPLTERVLESVQVAPDSRCLDVGCGMGETTRMLSRSIVPQGECVGLEQDSTLVDRANSEPWQGAPVSFRAGDAEELPFEDGSFDFVFTRYLLVHLPNPLQALREMRRVARKGGIVMAQEPDLAFSCSYPSNWAYERIPAIFDKLFADALVGRKLVDLLREAGCNDVAAEAGIAIEYCGSDIKRIYCLTVEAVGPALIESGMFTETEMGALLQEFARVEADESVVCIGNPVIAAWGKA